MVRRFRTRLVEIDAVQFDGTNFNELNAWTGDGFSEEGITVEQYDAGFRGKVYDFLHDTWIGVIPGQWIVRGAKGEHYPCDDETFHWKYEEVTA